MPDGFFEHLVVAGNTLWGLARTYNTTEEEIFQANKNRTDFVDQYGKPTMFTNPNLIEKGWWLWIPKTKKAKSFKQRVGYMRFFVNYLGIAGPFDPSVPHYGEDDGYEDYDRVPTTAVGGRNQPVVAPADMDILLSGNAGGSAGLRIWGVVENYASHEDIKKGLVTLPKGKTAADYPNGANMYLRALHHSKIIVGTGPVKEGTVIAYAGNSGTKSPHVHTEGELLPVEMGLKVFWSDELRREWGIPLHKECRLKDDQYAGNVTGPKYGIQKYEA